jgi:hypothetical protein
MPRRFPFAIQTILILLSSCSVVGQPAMTASEPTVNSHLNAGLTQTQTIVSTSSQIETPTVPSFSAPTTTPQTNRDRPLYTLDASLDYAGHSLTVEETILFKNTTGETLQELVMAVEPNLWTGCFILGGFLVNGQNTKKPILHGDKLEIPLVSPLDPGRSLIVSLQFDLHLPPADIHHVFGFNTRQANLVDWYPFIVPFVGGWILHPPANVGEHLTYDAADYDVTVTLVDKLIPVILAASAPGENNPGSWHYQLQNARTFVFSASPSYKTVSSTTDGVTITSYYFENNEIPARAVLDETGKALNTFGEIFGSYPHASLSIVESPFFDGMEYDGLFFLSQDYYASYNGTILNNLTDLAVHETAHQWWFGLVGNDQAMNPWLDEALATYSEELFFEKNLPKISAWWVFRVDSFSPAGWVDTDIYDGINFRTYANAVYLRGAHFLDALRTKIGEAAFFAFLKDYAGQMAGKISTGQDFFRILRTHSNADIMDIISAYFRHPY